MKKVLKEEKINFVEPQPSARGKQVVMPKVSTTGWNNQIFRNNLKNDRVNKQDELRVGSSTVK